MSSRLEQIAAARGERSRLFDTAEAVSFLPLFVFGAIEACSRLHRRFSAEQRSVRLVAIGLTSVVVTFLGLQIGQLWSSIWEAVRVRNGHMSPIRSATYTAWTHQHVGALFVGGMVMFWLVATSWRRATLGNLTRTGAMFSGTMLAAMFADVFVQHTIGYVVIMVALIVFYRVVSHRENAAGMSEPQSVLH